MLAVRSSLAVNVEGLEDRDGYGADLCSRRVFFCIGRNLLSQAKVELSQLVAPGVAGAQGCEYFPNVTKVPLHGPLLDEYPAGFQKAGAHNIGEDLEERYGIANTLEVGCDSQTFAELASLAPGVGVFLEECG